MTDKLPSTAPDQASRPAGALGLLLDLVGFNLRIGYNRAVSLFSRSFTDVDIAPIQFAALEYVANNPGCSQKDMATDIGSSAAALVSPLERLERHGWITRHRGTQDRRRARVHLTPEGHDMLRQARARVRRVDETLTSNLTDRETEQLLRLLQKLRGPEPGSGGQA